MSRAAAETKPPRRRAAAPEPSARAPGGITPEELGTLYNASKIELRAAQEANEALAGILTRTMQALGVETADEILAAVEKLKANRSQRRSTRPKTASRTRAR